MNTPADPQIIASVFLRKGGEGVKTKLFESFEPEQRAVLVAGAQLHQEEEPVVACIHNATEWFLVTTMRLIWSKADELGEMEILKLDTQEGNFEAAWNRWIAAEDREHRNPKMEIDELRLVSIDGKRESVFLEPGSPFYGLLNVTMWLCHWSRVQRERSTQ